MRERDPETRILAYRPSPHSKKNDLPPAVCLHLSIREWDREELIPQDTLFTLSELSDPLENVIRCYFLKRDRLQVPVDLYMSTIYHPDQLLRARFLTLVQAIEAYHRVSMPGKYMDEKNL